MLRGAAGAIVVAIGLAATALGATAIREKNSPARGDSTRPIASAHPVPASSDSTRVATDSATPTPMSSATASAPIAAAQPVVVKPAAPAPVLQMGSSSIAEGINAERTDTAVTLSFDTPMTRTRRSDKFEQLVRTTLPTIYGKKVDSVLIAMPSGALAKQGDLLTELPSRGMRIPVDSAWEIRVFPETRPGKDGPLVIRYRASTVAR
jgi:hypothetical protein